MGGLARVVGNEALRYRVLQGRAEDRVRIADAAPRQAAAKPLTVELLS